MLIPILTTLALAELSARDDAWQIRRNLIIDHVMQWYIRAVVVLGVCWLCGVPWLSIGLAGLFSAVFRWRLNRLRGLDWRYIAPWSSFYDRLWFLVETRNINFKEDVPLLIQYGQLIYNSKEYAFVQKFENRKNLAVLVHEYQRWIHRAGTIAYIFEGLVFAGVLYLYACCRGIFP